MRPAMFFSCRKLSDGPFQAQPHKSPASLGLLLIHSGLLCFFFFLTHKISINLQTWVNAESSGGSLQCQPSLSVPVVSADGTKKIKNKQTKKHPDKLPRAERLCLAYNSSFVVHQFEAVLKCEAARTERCNMCVFVRSQLAFDSSVVQGTLLRLALGQDDSLDEVPSGQSRPLSRSDS